MKCEVCSFVYADIALSDKQLGDLYRREYFFGDEYSNYLADKRVLQRNFRSRLRVLGKYLIPGRHKHLLELGCAYGFFLEAAHRYFDNVRGIDVTEDGVRYAREILKLDVVQANFLEYDLGESQLDVVCMWDTVEHLPSPDLFLEKLSNHMDSGSLLALTTGDIGSINARFRRSKWRLLHPPTHLSYFSRETLSRLLAKYGYEVVRSQYCGSYRSLDNVANNVLVVRNKLAPLYSLLRATKLLHVCFYSNLYDLLYVIARKK